MALVASPRRTFPFALTCAVVCACVMGMAAIARADPLADAALKAVNDARYCDARDLYSALYKKDPQAKFIYNAAESAYAADDRVSALSLYQELLGVAPEFERAKNAKKRVGELGKIVAKDGVGKPCSTRVPKCTDTILDPGEQCDDGNFIDGDGCDAGCKTTACGNAVLAPPEQCDDGNTTDNDGCSSTCTVVTIVAPPPPPPPAPEPTNEGVPLGPIVVTSTGALVAVTGAVVAVIGALPWLAMNEQSDRLREIRADYAKAEGDVQTALLAEALAVQENVDAERASWNELGQYLWIGGLTGLAVGLGTAGAGVGWWVAAE